MEIFVVRTEMEGETTIIGAYSSLEKAKDTLIEVMRFDEDFDPSPVWSDSERESTITTEDGSGYVGIVSRVTLDA